MSAAPIATAAEAAPQCEPQQALAFFSALFPAGSSIHLRAVAEPKDGRAAVNYHYLMDEKFADTLAGFLDWCANDHRAAYVLPGITRFGGTNKGDVQSLPAVLADFDTGDAASKLAAAEAVIGPSSIVVESGGATEHGLKLHAYWLLTESATGAAITEACKVRELIATRFGGDPCFKQPAQIVRVPGSLHQKGTPKLVKLRFITGRRYALDAISTALGGASPAVARPESPAFFDFNNVVPFESNVERALTAPVRSEGKDEITRFEAAGMAIGHFLRMVREGRMSEDEAWQAAQEWNQATLVPPWDVDRLRQDFYRLRDIDRRTHGPIAQPVVPLTAADDWDIEAWSIDRFAGAAPERRWLVDGLIPLGTAGVFAAPGDAGKTMLALRLAYMVGCYPPPQKEALGFNGAPRFFGCSVLGRGPVVMLTAEDDADEIHRRLAALDSDGLRTRGKQRVFVVPMPSAGGVRAIIADTREGPQPTPFWQTFRARLVGMDPKPALVILDPLSAFAAADVERDNRAGALLMTMLGELATATGAAVMLTHHTVKGATPGGLREARDAIRGVGSLVNNGRWALTMWEAEQDQAYEALKALGQQARARQAGVVYLGGLVKGNAPGAKVLRTLVRDPASGILEDATDALRIAAPKADDVDTALHAALWAKKQAEPSFSFTASPTALWTAWGDVITRLDLPVTKSGKARGRESITGVFDRMRSKGLIVQTQDRNPRFEPAPSPTP